ncbi:MULTISPECIES: gephyrin-like molybdotransferase receptor GlpR [unclassified Gordonia (in: high G+C Gram-positive bacteria)]|uniref:divisome protein SepX/GlpR n=1 Tax=unclassified Gordonia (in: high G+C Gram-positive bacteria) TaxID=2657482 RepID=UPI0010F4BEA3|nr:MULTISPECIES: gephyrin-like molybdotransferase receptor GlpR [unclassified Gordonia (in: high G+C Gram-positive bacteria)]
MPNSVLWVCLVAVWLFVLVPMVIKGRPQILKSTDAARKTRLLHRGGSRTTTATKNRRRSSARHPHDPSWKSSRRSATATLEAGAENDVDAEKAKPSTRRAGSAKVEKPTAESVDGEIDSETVDAASDDDSVNGDISADADADTDRDFDAESDDEATADADSTPAAEVDDTDELDDEYEDDFADVDGEVENGELEDAEFEDAEYDDDAEYGDDSEYEDATDQLDEDEYDDYARGSRHTESSSAPVAESEEDDADDAADTDLDEVADSRPAARTASSRRTGRSVYSSEKERELKYRERQRVTVGLFVLVLLSVVAGVVVGTPGWVATGVLGLLLVGYLAYLRRAVKTEQQIRAQRLARAKRSARAEEERRRRAAAVPEFAAAPPPPRLRRPGGATVLEIDDEDPVFDHIPPFQRRRMDREDLQYRRVG